MGTYFCFRTFWPRPRVTVPNVAPSFHRPDALSEGMAPSDVTYFCVPKFWPRPCVTVPNVAPGFHLPDALSEGRAPSDVTYFCVPSFWPRPRVSVPNVAPGFVDTTCCAGAGGVWADSSRAVPCRSRTLRFRGRFGVDPLFRCAYRSSGKALTVQGQPPFHRRRAPFGTPRLGGHARGTGLPAGGGHAKGPQDATAGILALLSRVWYPARRAIALSVVFLKETSPKAACGTRAWGVK